MADAFRASSRIDDVKRVSHRNGRIGAHRLAHVAVDAFVGDLKRHECESLAGARRRRQLGLQPALHARENELRGVAAQLRDFSNDRARHELILLAGR